MRNKSSTSESPALRRFDWLERGCIVALYGWLVARIVGSYLESGNAANLILLASEGLVVVFILVRRSTGQISLQPIDWILAGSATLVPLLVVPLQAGPGSATPLVSQQVAAVMMLSGLIFQVYAKISLGRSFGCVPAHRGLSLGGPYRFVRHPIYTGYLIGHLAFALMNPSGWNLVVYGVAYALQVPRLLAEERLLSRDPRYQQYMAAVRYRLLPGLY